MKTFLRSLIFWRPKTDAQQPSILNLKRASPYIVMETEESENGNGEIKHVILQREGDKHVFSVKEIQRLYGEGVVLSTGEVIMVVDEIQDTANGRLVRAYNTTLLWVQKPDLVCRSYQQLTAQA